MKGESLLSIERKRNRGDDGHEGKNGKTVN